VAKGGGVDVGAGDGVGGSGDGPGSGGVVGGCGVSGGGVGSHAANPTLIPIASTSINPSSH
jgi:hypothetical protein